MSKIIISVDSTADLTLEMLTKYDIRKINTGVVIGSEAMTDADLTPEDIYKAVEIDGLVPKTNACLETDYRELFEDATKDGGSIIHFNISDRLSASHTNAKRAAEGLNGVYVVDSKMLTFGIGILAIKACEMRDKGMSAKEIYDEIIGSTIKNVDVSFIINDLKYLYKGGRASGLKLLGANILKIRPSLEMDGSGMLVPARKFKGDFAHAVREFTKHKLEQNPNVNKDFVILAHSDIDPKIPAQVIEDLKAAGFKEIWHHNVGVSVTIHCGRNTIGMVMFNN